MSHKLPQTPAKGKASLLKSMDSIIFAVKSGQTPNKTPSFGNDNQGEPKRRLSHTPQRNTSTSNVTNVDLRTPSAKSDVAKCEKPEGHMQMPQKRLIKNLPLAGEKSVKPNVDRVKNTDDHESVQLHEYSLKLLGSKPSASGVTALPGLKPLITNSKTPNETVQRTETNVSLDKRKSLHKSPEEETSLGSPVKKSDVNEVVSSVGKTPRKTASSDNQTKKKGIDSVSDQMPPEKTSDLQAKTKDLDNETNLLGKINNTSDNDGEIIGISVHNIRNENIMTDVGEAGNSKGSTKLCGDKDVEHVSSKPSSKSPSKDYQASKSVKNIPPGKDVLLKSAAKAEKDLIGSSRKGERFPSPKLATLDSKGVETKASGKVEITPSSNLSSKTGEKNLAGPPIKGKHLNPEKVPTCVTKGGKSRMAHKSSDPHPLNLKKSKTPNFASKKNSATDKAELNLSKNQEDSKRQDDSPSKVENNQTSELSLKPTCTETSKATSKREENNVSFNKGTELQSLAAGVENKVAVETSKPPKASEIEMNDPPSKILEDNVMVSSTAATVGNNKIVDEKMTLHVSKPSKTAKEVDSSVILSPGRNDDFNPTKSSTPIAINQHTQNKRKSRLISKEIVDEGKEPTDKTDDVSHLSSIDESLVGPNMVVSCGLFTREKEKQSKPGRGRKKGSKNRTDASLESLRSKPNKQIKLTECSIQLIDHEGVTVESKDRLNTVNPTGNKMQPDVSEIKKIVGMQCEDVVEITAKQSQDAEILVSLAAPKVHEDSSQIKKTSICGNNQSLSLLNASDGGHSNKKSGRGRKKVKPEKETNKVEECEQDEGVPVKKKRGRKPKIKVDLQKTFSELHTDGIHNKVPELNENSLMKSTESVPMQNDVISDFDNTPSIKKTSFLGNNPSFSLLNASEGEQSTKKLGRGRKKVKREKETDKVKECEQDEGVPVKKKRGRKPKIKVDLQETFSELHTDGIHNKVPELNENSLMKSTESVPMQNDVISDFDNTPSIRKTSFLGNNQSFSLLNASEGEHSTKKLDRGRKKVKPEKETDKVKECEQDEGVPVKKKRGRKPKIKVDLQKTFWELQCDAVHNKVEEVNEESLMKSTDSVLMQNDVIPEMDDSPSKITGRKRRKITKASFENYVTDLDNDESLLLASTPRMTGKKRGRKKKEIKDLNVLEKPEIEGFGNKSQADGTSPNLGGSKPSRGSKKASPMKKIGAVTRELVVSGRSSEKKRGRRKKEVKDLNVIKKPEIAGFGKIGAVMKELVVSLVDQAIDINNGVLLQNVAKRKRTDDNNDADISVTENEPPAKKIHHEEPDETSEQRFEKNEIVSETRELSAEEDSEEEATETVEVTPGRSKRPAALRAKKAWNEINELIQQSEIHYFSPNEQLPVSEDFLFRVRNELVQNRDKKTVLTCPFEKCGKPYWNYASLRYHLKTCPRGRRSTVYSGFECAECGFRIKSEKAMKKHIKTHVLAEFKKKKGASCATETDSGNENDRDYKAESADESSEEEDMEGMQFEESDSDVGTTTPKRRKTGRGQCTISSLAGRGTSLVAERHENRSKYMDITFLQNFTDDLTELRLSKMPPILENPFQWTLDFTVQHAREHLYSAFHYKPEDFTVLSHSEGNAVLPRSSSVTVSFCEARSRFSKDAGPVDLGLFEARNTAYSESCTVNVGGPTWALAWCPVPLSQTTSSQLLALYCHTEASQEHKIHATHMGTSLVQMWDCGQLHSKSSCSPSLAYCLSLRVGAVWDMCWCPTGCYDATEDLGLGAGVGGGTATNVPRAGLLAMACSAGHVEILSVPTPAYVRSLPHSDSQGPVVLKPKSRWRLCAQFRGEPVANCLCVDWQWTGGCRRLVAGFSDGSVCLWDLTTCSSLLRRQASHGAMEWRPYRTFPSHKEAVTGARFCQRVPHCVITASLDRDVKVWDTRSPDCPSEQHSRSRATSLVTPINWLTWISGYDDSFMFGRNSSYASEAGYLEKAGYNLICIKSTVTGQSFSHWLNSVAMATTGGEVFVNYLHFGLYINRIKKSVAQRRVILYTSNSMDSTGKKTQSKDKPQSEQCPSTERFSPLSSQTHATATTDISTTSPEKSVPFQSTSEETSATPGVVFKDVKLLQNEDISKTCGDGAVECFLTHGTRQAYVNRVAWNPNLGSHTWLASATNGGLLRLHRVSALETSGMRKVQQQFLKQRTKERMETFQTVNP